MELNSRLKFTKAIILISILGSIMTCIIGAFGYGELYPFFSYKLYTQPLGSKNTYTDYRIYSRSTINAPFERNEIKESQTFDFDGYLYTFSFLIGNALEAGNEQEENKKKLLIFAKHIVPGKVEYKIVSETYQPKDLLRKDFPYDTATVIVF